MTLTNARIAIAVSTMLIVVSCSSTPAPRTELGAAEQAISQAQAAEAAIYASAELRQARNNLQAAQSASREGENLRARRLAEEAQVSAELAAAKAEKAKSQTVLKEMQQSVDTLREQALPDSRGPDLAPAGRDLGPQPVPR